MTEEQAKCGCWCICHEDEWAFDWPGPCAACCEPGDDCACGRALAPEHPTRQERREERGQKRREFQADNRRSIRLQTMLSARPKRRRR